MIKVNKNVIVALLGVMLTTGCSAHPVVVDSEEFKALDARVENLEAEVIALRAENHALATAIGINYDEEESDYEPDPFELESLK